MPPRRKKSVGAAATTAAATESRTRRSTRRATKSKNVVSRSTIPDVYQEMLVEAGADASGQSSPDPHRTKRRKLSSSPARSASIDDLFGSPQLSANPKVEEHEDKPTSSTYHQHVFVDDFEGSEESDVEFEDVEIELAAQSTSADEKLPKKSIQIDLGRPAIETQTRAVQRRKPISKEERALRLDVHKWHLLSLIGHGLHRNSWCNREEVHLILKPMVPRKIIKLLHADESKPQYEQNHSFNKGVEEICALWRQLWKIIVPGLRKACWREDVDARDSLDDAEDLEFEDFRDAARSGRGSRDLGAQIFTALLRSIAIDARLVFSLQVLPFAGVAKAETPVKTKSKSNYIHAPAQNYGVTASTSSPFAQPLSKPKKLKKIVDSPYPIFWTEILSPNQTWIPLDPIVRGTIAKPKTQFEPPLSDDLNNMTYVVAYEEDNSVRDVTRRYAQWYNAKTRKLRVESTKNGEKWYTAALKVLQRNIHQLRDEIESDELTRRTNSEGMPHNIQDFKNHPIYVLERHMRANEVLQPKREVGKVNVGTAKNGKIESVYRRKDVHSCRTADAWFRRGRDVKEGEQPLTSVLPKSRFSVDGPIRLDSEDEYDITADAVGMYAEYQTNIYKPPPVADGQIPKNAYGNLDVYVPSMIPPGAVHIAHPLAASAAKAVGIDFADAVTGFEFKGRQGTAVVSGVVVAEQFTAAIAAVIDGLEVMGSEEVQLARSKILLGVWKRMLQSLRVRERVEAEYGSTETAARQELLEDEEENDPSYRDGDGQGGFMADDELTEEKVHEQTVELQLLKAKMPTVLPEEVTRAPIVVTRSPHKLPVVTPTDNDHISIDNSQADELFEDQEESETAAGGGGGGFPIANDEDDIEMSGGFIANADEEQGAGGGFLPNDDDMTGGEEGEGGGFMPDTTTTPHHRSNRPAHAPPAATTTSTTNTMSDVTTRSRLQQHNNTTTLDKITDAVHSHSHSHSDIEEQEDAAIQQAIADSLATRPRQSVQHTQPDAHDSSAGEAEVTGNDTIDELGTSKRKERQISGDSDVQSTSSLLSHDPDEDEEEPEWINDALEE